MGGYIELFKHVNHLAFIADFIMGLTKKTRLKIAMVTTTLMFFGELIFGFISGSLALTADAFHMIGDLLGICIAHHSITLTIRTKTSHQHTYGYQRAETLGALINATFLLGLCFTIILTAIQRFFKPEAVTQPLIVLFVGVAGLVVNLFSMILFHDSHHDSVTPPQTNAPLTAQQVIAHQHQHAGKLNMRGAFLHVMGDTLASVGVIISAALEKWVPWDKIYYVDPAMSIIIAGIIIFHTWPLFRKTCHIVLHVVPSHIEMDKLQDEIKKIQNIKDVHEFHVWPLSDMKMIASVHVILEDDAFRHDGFRMFMDVSAEIKQILHSHGIHNTTVQLEIPAAIAKADGEKIAKEIEDEMEREQENGGSSSKAVIVPIDTEEAKESPECSVEMPLEDCLMACEDTSCHIVTCCP